MTLPPDLLGLNEAAKDALILAQAETISFLTARVADLEAKLNAPVQTPNNSSKPPSQGLKPNEEPKPKARRKRRKGPHIAPPPNRLPAG